MNKKGILGLDTVKAVILSLMVLAVLVIAVFAVLIPLRTSVEGIDARSGSVINDSTVTKVNDAAYTLLPTAYYLRNSVCTVSACRNSSNGVAVNAANWSASNCQVNYAGTGPGSNSNNSIWKCDYSYTYNGNDTNTIVETMTKAPVNFFNNTPTFFTLLGVVVLILIIAIVIVAVTRFSPGASIGLGAGGGEGGGSLENI